MTCSNKNSMELIYNFQNMNDFLINNQLSSSWDKLLRNIKDLWWSTEMVKTNPPISIEEISMIEKNIGVKLPEEYIHFITNRFSWIHLYWHFETWMNNVNHWKINWNIHEINSLYKEYTSWIKDCFNDIHNPYDLIWHDKLPLIKIDNWDFIAYDLKDPKIVYLSHDDWETHWYFLWNNFLDFIIKWTNVCVIWPEWWDIKNFIDTPTGWINPYWKNAITLKELLWMR
ncbi:MAG: SMI1 / KNR4 family [uncultured bacterium (gcode 4)]|uniref:SMI1 / KNR4 family n=1 Tax=uncultured bacterium (gcode 4) TaxID=1234023 RepID=K2G269_9BACT|nr:MAG: SMI1 / KNR4 family [uncultured bacterium (gcode 4)]